MSVEQIIGLVVTLLVMCIGLAGSILPGLPGTPVILLAAIGHKVYFGEAGAGWVVLSMLTLLMLASLVVDYLASVYGAKRLGATRRGMIGAIVGGLVGIFFALPGLLLGPFLGALAFEMAGGRTFKDGSRAGLGATLGLLAGTLGKVLCSVSMMLLFGINVVWRNQLAS
jgi:hypothetical protein